MSEDHTSRHANQSQEIDSQEVAAAALRLLQQHSDAAREAFHQSEWEEDMGDKLEAAYIANHDELTGMLNRRGLLGLVANLEPSDQPRYVVFMDITNFKAVNDVISHKRGDEVIKSMADIISKRFRPEDIISRLGGDEFFVIMNNEPRPNSQLSDEDRPKSVESAVDNIKRTIAHGVYRYLDGNPDLQDLNLELAVGALPWNGEPFVEIMDKADTIMQQDKNHQHQELGTYRPRHTPQVAE
jgi:diguanylate cyclase (GGDEF)-like protein